MKIHANDCVGDKLQEEKKSDIECSSMLRL